MKKIFLFIVLTLFWIVLLFPKVTVWDNFSKFMQKQGIETSAKSVNDKRYELTLHDINISLDDLNIATISKADAKLWLFYDEIVLRNFNFQENLPVLSGLKITNAKIRYTILSPKKIDIIGSSDIGDFKAKIDLFDHKGAVWLQNEKIQDPALKTYFKKSKEGMRYEFSY